MNCPIGVSDRDLLVSLNRLAIVTGAMYLVSEVRRPKKTTPSFPSLGGVARSAGVVLASVCRNATNHPVSRFATATPPKEGN